MTLCVINFFYFAGVAYGYLKWPTFLSTESFVAWEIYILTTSVTLFYMFYQAAYTNKETEYQII